MRTKVQKWGNSLAVRIPKPFAEDAGLEAESSVDLVVRGGSVVVTPVRARPRLAALLRRVRAANLHGEIDSGQPVGRESW
jgi:antitoxin MazE